MSDQLWLVQHLVRGEPAYDVACMIGEDSDGEVWIIPTSGHRCYPNWLVQELNMKALNEVVIPEGWPDHYSVKAIDGGYGHKEYRREAVSDLLNRLGLNRKPSLMRRLPK